jgi:metallo-beta-lactamase class B
VAVKDGDKLKLGDTSVELRVTRTHTPGTISPIITVRDSGRQHRVMIWGGTALNFGPLPERLSSYAAAVDQMRQIAAQRDVDTFMHTHPNADTWQRLEALARRVPGEPHPYVIGRKRVDAVLAKMGECVRANAAAIPTAAPAAR